MLITGAKGFIGSHVSTYFKKLGYETFGIGHGDLYVDECKKIGLDYWIKSEITLKTLCELNQEFDSIIHCGGSGSVDFSVKNPYDDFKKTVDATLEVLEYMRLYNPNAKLIYPSSPAVCGEHDDSPIKESCKRKPLSPYGYHKKIAEDLCKSYSDKYNLNIKIIRLFSVYGETLKKQLLWDSCNKLSTSQNVIKFWGTGKETRDFIHIDDVLTLMSAILDESSHFLIVNGGSGIRYEISQIVHKIDALLAQNKIIEFTNDLHIGNPIYYLADIDVALSLGWKPSISLDDGLKNYVLWFKSL